MMISTYLWIAVGGAFGSVARFWLAVFVADRLGPEFPWGTIFINILGSFVIGFFATISGPGGRFAASFNTRAFVMVGICGGFTTFSAFSLQTLDLARESRWLQAGGNIALSVVLCLLAVWAGHALATVLPTSTQE
jgi:CrcB protein